MWVGVGSCHMGESLEAEEAIRMSAAQLLTICNNLVLLQLETVLCTHTHTHIHTHRFVRF
jgi:hypothetical protein